MNGITKGETMTLRHDLITALTRASAICNPRSAIPILASAHIRASEERLSVYATDLAIAIESHIACSDYALDTCVDAKRLLAAVKAMPGDELPALDVAKNQLVVKAAKRRIALDVRDASEYPTGPAFGEGATLTTVQRVHLLNALRPVVHCTSDDDSRPNLAGVYLSVFSDFGFEAVATNGHALALHPWPDGEKPVMSVLVPSRAVREMVRALEESTAKDVVLSYDPVRFGIALPDVSITATLINAAFPDWRQVVPKRGDVRATVDREALRSSLASVCTVAEGQTSCVVLTVDDGAIKLDATNADVGAASDSIECQTEGKLKCGVSARYLGAALAASEGETITLSSSGRDIDPLRIDAGNVIHVIMPMRV